MSKQKVKVVQRKAPPAVIHEHNGKNQHRIVLVDEQGERVSRWFETHQIGNFEGFYCASYNNGQPVPVGIFRLQQVPYRILPSDQIAVPGTAFEARSDCAKTANRQLQGKARL